MPDETFAEATMRKLRQLEAENRRKDQEIARLKRRIEQLENPAPSPWDRYWPPKPRWSMRCEVSR
jgi:hypothetical protein